MNTKGGAGKTLSASSCSVACSGDSTSKCGGGYSSILYHNPTVLSNALVTTLPAGWNLYASCLSDSTTSRLLPILAYSSALNLLATCVNTCASSGYLYAGVEYGVECWCATKLNTAGGSGKTVTGCTLPCPGGHGTCGAAGKIGPVFWKGAAQVTISTSSKSKLEKPYPKSTSRH